MGNVRVLLDQSDVVKDKVVEESVGIERHDDGGQQEAEKGDPGPRRVPILFCCRHLSTPFHKYDDVCGWVLRGEVEERGGGDAVASLTTNDKEIARNPHPPEGLGRDGPHLFVAPPRRWLRIDSSSRLNLVSVALPTNIIVFMEVST